MKKFRLGLEMETLVLFVSVFLCIAAVLDSGGILGVEGYAEYNTAGGIVDGKLNVHLVAHSHDDVGWLKTVDQYYVGSNNSIQVDFLMFSDVSFVSILLLKHLCLF